VDIYGLLPQPWLEQEFPPVALSRVLKQPTRSQLLI
jgi:hypothetical protein